MDSIHDKPEPLPYRKTKRTFDTPGNAHELTFCTYKRKPFFKDTVLAGIFLRHLDAARTKLEFKLWAYVIMPEHVHLLVWPGEAKANVRTILREIKLWSGRECLASSTAVKEACTIYKSDGSTSHRFWLPGGGYDRNLWSSEAILSSINYIHNNPVKRGLSNTSSAYPWSSAAALDGQLGLPYPDLYIP
jgi:putative transposase